MCVLWSEKTMSNPIANHLFIYGPRQNVSRFFAEFLLDGLDAHVPIPPDAEPSVDPATKYRSREAQIRIDHWGTSWIDQDMYWKYGSAHGVAFQPHDGSEECRITKYGQLQLDQFGRFNPTESLLSDPVERPGYRRPSEDDAVAYLKFFTPWKEPSKWFGTVATALFPTLRFFMQSFDLCNFPGEHPEFWSIDGRGEYHQDGNWAAWITESDVDDDVDDPVGVDGVVPTEPLATAEAAAIE
jgi:hypothetical protein